MPVPGPSFATAAPRPRELIESTERDQLPNATGSTSMATAHRLVAICVPTCKRPANLAALLESVQRLDHRGWEIHIVIVDNDEAQSAQPVVQKMLDGSAIPYTYDCVAERNLPVVRNRLVSLATSIGAAWIWFLDDDQFVAPDALRRMLATAEDTGADCVVPRVRYDFGDSSASWAQWSGIFDELHRPTGKPTKRFGTNGPLCRVALVSALPQPFDPALKFVGGHHGGEDGHFFARLRALGSKTIGCDEAVLHDRVHASRNTPRWLMHRALRIGLIKGFLVREVDPSLTKTASLLVAGAGYGGLNLLLTLVLLPLGPSRFFRPWIRAVQGYGVVLGVLTGRRFLRGRESTQVHGR
jgi:succinoglycan biosynthesis protein ExoM